MEDHTDTLTIQQQRVSRANIISLRVVRISANQKWKSGIALDTSLYDLALSL